MTGNLGKSLLTPVAGTDSQGVKITVVGCGAVGMACVFGILHEQICSEICVIDMATDKAKGEALDMTQGCIFIHGSPRIYSSSDYSAAANSSIIVVTAGARTREGESRLNLVQRNTDIFKAIIPPLAQSSPNAIFLVITNPCDILAYVTMKLTKFPPNRIISAGTNLDSARFRYYIAEKLGIAPASVHGWVLGEHGDSSVPLWSTVNVSGVRLTDLNPAIGTQDDPEFYEINKLVPQAAYEIISLKGYTNWGIGLSCGNICSAILRDSREVVVVSTYLRGCKSGVDKDVYLSLPCVLGRNGVLYIVKQSLSPIEKKQLIESANIMHEIQKGIQGLEI